MPPPMEPTPALLQQLLAIAALVAGTLEYAIVVRHRVDRRTIAAEDAWGLRGLVRVTLAAEEDRPRRRRRWRRLPRPG